VFVDHPIHVGRESPCLEGEPSNRNQAAVHGVRGEPEPLQGVCAEERHAARIPEHDARGQCRAVPARQRHGHIAGDDAAVGGHEFTAELWRDPEVVKDIGRDPGMVTRNVPMARSPYRPLDSTQSAARRTPAPLAPGRREPRAGRRDPPRSLSPV